MATELENASVEELQAALDAAKAKKAEQERIAREERRARERAEFETRVDAYREDNADEFVGDHREWLGLNAGYSGGLELTIHEGTTPQSGITLSADSVQKLKAILNEIA
ncbi:MAG: hypothetical protein H9W81_07600 [Enterococcus sp.]|nr:hypothetical protein [Enterococcus sp.]